MLSKCLFITYLSTIHVIIIVKISLLKFFNSLTVLNYPKIGNDAITDTYEAYKC